MLEDKFQILCKPFSQNEQVIAQLWRELKVAYSKPTRYYHTLQHLEHIYKELEPFELSPLLEFAIFYHDIVYDVKQNDNEEQSALLAQKRLTQLTLPQELNKQLFELIVETKTHKSSSKENRLFLDADLAILGDNYVEYRNYICNIRKEYTIYNDEIYNSGRMKVLEKFLEKEKIYQSEYFYEKYEKKAKYNLGKEYKEIKARYSI